MGNGAKRRTPEQAYREHHDDIGVLLDLLALEAQVHAAYAEVDGIDWAKAGDLACVRRGLIEALADLAQQDNAFIEGHLHEMRQERG